MRFSIPKTWKDMRNSHEAIIGFLKYEVVQVASGKKQNLEHKALTFFINQHLLSESSSTIEDFLWIEDNSNEDFQRMTTRTVYTSKCMKREKKARIT